jgi:uncharacterized protein YecE (DUF72 family)
MKVWIGTSGYSYPDWVGPVYPPGTKPAEMLREYARHFPLVELNFSFYRTPTAAVFARQADQTPDGFQFLVKVPRSITHDPEPDDLPGFRAAAEELRGRGRLLGLLLQMPPSFQFKDRARQWLATLGRELQGLSPAVEFRHRSWDRPEVPGWLGEQGLDLIAVDVPDLPKLYPRGLVRSGRRIYVRFHSRNAGNWYSSHERRYDYAYPEDQLKEWAAALNEAAGEADQALLLFNNCFRGQAVDNARQLREVLRREAPALEVVPPFAPREG